MNKLLVIEGPNVHAFAHYLHSIHSLWKSKQMRAIYVPLMCKSDLVIRIAGFAIIIGVYWYCFSHMSARLTRLVKLCKGKLSAGLGGRDSAE